MPSLSLVRPAHALGQACRLLGLALLAVLLSGCFVTSEVPLEGEGSTMDPALIGVWRGLDDEGKFEPGYFLHVYQKRRDAELEMVWIQKDVYSGMGVTTTSLSGRRFMNITFHKRADNTDPSDAELFAGTVIVHYEIRGRELWIALMNEKVWSEAVESGHIKGRFSSDNKTTRSLHLTASPRELSDFIAKGGTATLFQPLKRAFRRGSIQ